MEKLKRGTTEYYDEKLAQLFCRKKIILTKFRRARKNAIIKIDKKIRWIGRKIK